jgi:hypothetical protein
MLSRPGPLRRLRRLVGPRGSCQSNSFLHPPRGPPPGRGSAHARAPSPPSPEPATLSSCSSCFPGVLRGRPVGAGGWARATLQGSKDPRIGVRVAAPGDEGPSLTGERALGSGSRGPAMEAPREEAPGRADSAGGSRWRPVRTPRAKGPRGAPGVRTRALAPAVQTSGSPPPALVAGRQQLVRPARPRPPLRQPREAAARRGDAAVRRCRVRSSSRSARAARPGPGAQGRRPAVPVPRRLPGPAAAGGADRPGRRDVVAVAARTSCLRRHLGLGESGRLHPEIGAQGAEAEALSGLVAVPQPGQPGGAAPPAPAQR